MNYLERDISTKELNASNGKMSFACNIMTMQQDKESSLLPYQLDIDLN